MEEYFEQLAEELNAIDNAREELIINSRPIIKLSKKAIYALHQNDVAKAQTLLADAQQQLKQLQPSNTTGAYNAALQEYVEAMSYLIYVNEKRLASHEELAVDVENYLLGICDLTGELTRKVVMLATKKDIEAVKEIKEFLDQLFTGFLSFTLRNGELRKKADSIKWNIKKVEEVLYDLSIRQ